MVIFMRCLNVPRTCVPISAAVACRRDCSFSACCSFQYAFVDYTTLSAKHPLLPGLSMFSGKNTITAMASFIIRQLDCRCRHP
ncbi:hypothetical protein T01_2072 [Trichinella spiralis]|uniref:Uncharacterized protein n=1 Tax=Trichinella spiralis TaxID=6334 RepID=A0A0V1B971_TRISP|nr:hypothetical protein T01_1042 [Trichinella spiralis]KRY33514.1 hypothetical protein T01_2072 [Trichinella spiralis]